MQSLAAAPLEYTSSQGAEVILPMPDGSMQRFEVENSPVIAPELAVRYPEIQTYRIRGLDAPSTTGRLDMTPKGFHGMLHSSAGTVYIDPDQSGGYRSYFQRDYVAAKKGFTNELDRPACLVISAIDEIAAARPSAEVAQRISGSRRVYRLALAATGEYTQFHGGTITDALSAMVTTINRLNAVFGRDVAIQFVIVSNNDSVIYVNPETDPYTNDDASMMLLENQKILDNVIGSWNYDIGHVFSTGGGGLAVVGSTCHSDIKAKGVTGMAQPTGDAFYIDLVAHEIGHQLDAVHTFNGTSFACASSRQEDSAVEPGSGSSVMSYSGICGPENLQQDSDATFHAISIQQIVGFITSGGGSRCGALSTTGNSAPVVNAGPDYTIPAKTPFALQGSATDVDDEDTLSYQWDEMDVGGIKYATDADSFGTDLVGNPLFRSFLPKDTPLRIFPRLRSLLESDTDPAEILPTTQRELNFRLTVRDGESGIGEDDVYLAVVESAGPFAIIEPLGSSYTSGDVISIKWSVADTQLSPIDCTQMMGAIRLFYWMTRDRIGGAYESDAVTISFLISTTATW
jgi:hypothetical protein